MSRTRGSLTGLSRLGKTVVLGATVVAVSSPISAKDITITFWEAHSKQEEEATMRMVELFHKRYPDIRVNQIKQDFGTNFEKVFVAVAGGAAPDVTPIWGGLLSSFAAAKSIVSLSRWGADSLKPAFFPGAWEFTQDRGATYGIPYAADPRFLVYNKSMFAEAGLEKAPETWDELIIVARKLKQGDGSNVVRWGFMVSPNTELFSSLLWSSGGSFFNSNMTQATFNSPAGVKALTFLTDIINTYTVAKSGGRGDFLAGRTAMVIDGPWVLYEREQTAKELAFDVSHIPIPMGGTRVNQASVGAYVMYSHTKEPEAVYKFLTFMGSREAQAQRVLNLKTAVRSDVIGAPELRVTFSRFPQLVKMHEILSYSRIYPTHPKWADIMTILDRAIQESVAGRKSPEISLDEAARQVNQILSEAAATK